MSKKEFPVTRAAAWAVLCLSVAVAVLYFLPPLFLSALPFLFAWGMAVAVRPLAARIAVRTHLKTAAVSVFLVFFFLLLVAVGLFFLLRQAALELLALGTYLGEGGAAGIWERVLAFGAVLGERFPHLGTWLAPGLAEGKLAALSEQALLSLGEEALRAAAALVGAAPLFFVGVPISLVAAFYFARDLRVIHRALLSLLPPAAAARAKQLQNGVFRAAGGYLRAYLCLAGVTFLLLSLGFLLLRVPCAVLVAAVLALLDFLPAIGMDMLLIPWAVFSFLTGNPFLGFGLLILYFVLWLMRQVLEPRLLGHHLGLHPLIAMAAMYAGLRFFGFFGMILLPAICALGRTCLPRQTVPGPPPGNAADSPRRSDAPQPGHR